MSKFSFVCFLQYHRTLFFSLAVVNSRLLLRQAFLNLNLLMNNKIGKWERELIGHQLIFLIETFVDNFKWAYQ